MKELTLGEKLPGSSPGLDSKFMNTKMTKNKSLGNKLKYFRNRAEVSQLELENEIGASPGSVSRIESGKTNPTRATLFKIIKALKLNRFEFDYLIGMTNLPVGQEEIDYLVSWYTDYFSQKGILAYLIDERYRIIFTSKDFQRLLGLSDKDVTNLIGKPLPQIMLEPELKIFEFINNDKLKDTLFHNLVKYYYAASFMIGDKFLEASLKAINSNTIAKEIWDNIKRSQPKDINTLDSRKVKFQLGKVGFEMWYSSELVSISPRFEIIEYTPTNKVLRLLSKII